MKTGLDGRRALVCGASKGLGYACAKMLCQEGVDVVLLARDAKLLSERVKSLERYEGEAAYIEADLLDTESLPDVVERAKKIYGGFDILVNNTGGPPSGPNLSFTREDWERAFRLTFLSAEEITKLLIEEMAARRWGRIINLTSITVKQPVEGLILSNSIRMAIIGWAKTLSLEYASKGVTINNIATGYTMTERIDELAKARARDTGRGIGDVIREMAANIPMRRMADPSEVASAVVFLASEAASYITGVTLPVDGGYIVGM